MNKINPKKKKSGGAFLLMLFTFIWSCRTFMQALETDKLWLKVMTVFPMIIFFGILIVLFKRIIKTK